MEDLFIEGKSLVDRFTQSCEFDKLDGNVMKSTGSTHEQQDFGGGGVGRGLVHRDKGHPRHIQ